ncbi:DNA-binding protein [Streptomyces curacoi]|uniref:DNA-binding protein n=2 Tax=Streptomyces curacoi TaxID=146536 RepID=A0A117PI67_9ACTN|nr:DNA-binding protein [Streptomyces curacoi]
MSGAMEAGETEALALLLRELKDRSGLSYGALAKRLHMSTSTLHRYCNGTAVPIEYAPVERLARVCRATPQELVELHRRWILADAARGRRAAGPETAASGPAVSPGPDESANGDPVVAGVPGELAPPRRPRRLPRRRTALIASVAVAAALAAVVLTLPPSDGGGHDTVAGQAGTATETTAGRADGGKPSAGPSPSGKGNKPPAAASASPTASEDAGSGASKGDGRQGAARPTDGNAVDAVPLTVRTRPYVYDSPCSQHFLVDSEPEQVGPPATEQDAPRWADAYGAVSSGEQRVALTVQGTGEDTVVLEKLHVRVLTKGAPLAWNDYSMGVGCGGGVDTRSFDVALDHGSPTVTVKNGQRDFPYQVSESDPEVFYVTAHTKAYDVRWDLTLEWSSGSRRGTVHIDDNGSPFRTSADKDRPGYDYPLGGGEWVER